jgi:hypothetical protein
MENLFRVSLAKYVSFFSLWELKIFAQKAFGDVPVAWRCAAARSPLVDRVCDVFPGRRYLEHVPFGSSLVFYASMRYRVKTNQHPLKVSLKKTPRSVVSGVTREGIQQVSVVPQDERSVSV